MRCVEIWCYVVTPTFRYAAIPSGVMVFVTPCEPIPFWRYGDWCRDQNLSRDQQSVKSEGYRPADNDLTPGAYTVALCIHQMSWSLAAMGTGDICKRINTDYLCRDMDKYPAPLTPPVAAQGNVRVSSFRTSPNYLPTATVEQSPLICRSLTMIGVACTLVPSQEHKSNVLVTPAFLQTDARLRQTAQSPLSPRRVFGGISTPSNKKRLGS